MSRLTPERLRELVFYDKKTGEFIRLARVSSTLPGPVNPRPSKQGYLRMRIDGELHYLHRLAWLYSHGMWPSKLIDHVNGDKCDNRLENLRDASHGENFQNLTIKANNASGLRGVYYNSQVGKWQAKIMVKRKTFSLGYFSSPEAAHQAYLDGKRKHHTFNPEFTR